MSVILGLFLMLASLAHAAGPGDLASLRKGDAVESVTIERAGELLADVEHLRAELVERRGQLESRIRRIQEAVRLQYASGAASVDDWLT